MARGSLRTGFLAFAAAAGLAGGAYAQKLPDTMVWTTYDVGSTGYNEASAIADALQKKHNVRVRLLPSGTGIGRTQPLLSERAGYGWLATELLFAVEGKFEYTKKDVGPQDLRVLLGRENSLAIAVTKESGIKTIADLKGRKFAWVPGNPSVNVKVEAILAFAGLTTKDLQLVTVASYNNSMKALLDGTAEAVGVAPAAATLREVEASPRGLAWVPIPPDDKQGWQRIMAIAPVFFPVKETIGAGLSKDNPVDMIGYRYPQITVFAAASTDDVYNFTKAVVEAFPMYKDAQPIMPRWDAKLAGKTPQDAPFHDGAIRYLKEIGVWTPEDEEWNARRLAALKKIQAAWKDTLKAAEQEKVADDKFAEFWDKRRQAALAQ